MTFAEAQKIIATARGGAEKPLEHNTRLVDRGVYFTIQYHQTDVVRICRNGAYYLDTGGWHTATTKARINRYTPAAVQLWREKHIWYIAIIHRTYIFQDGMRIGPRGGVSGAKRRK